MRVWQRMKTLRVLMPLALTILAAIATIIGFERLAAGSVRVIDPTGRAISATLTNRQIEQPLTRIADGSFVGRPKLEGFIRVRCRDGRVLDREYVTPSMDTELRPEGSNSC